MNTGNLALDMLRRRPTPPSIHLNVRISGEDADIYRQLSERTAKIKDSDRVRDAVRVALFLMAMREAGQPVMCRPAGKSVEVLDYLEVFAK